MLISDQLTVLINVVASAADRLLLMHDQLDQATHELPQQYGGEGWLVNGAQGLLVQFRPVSSAVHVQWVELRMFRWVRPHPPVPESQRRMLHANAVDAWHHMLKVGWRRCEPPVR